jgi:Zn-dependent M28 family amino/carboxypeptidase
MQRPLIALLASLACAQPALAQHAPSPDSRVIAQLRPATIWGALRFLADDALEGRGTGARGGELAAHYIASQFMAMGLQPAGDSGTWFHNVPIVTLVPTPTISATTGSAPRTLRFRDDFVAWAERPDSVVSVSAELVFVGFGIAAPEWQWDDYKGMDVRGKILVMLVNDPGLRNPDIFRGKILTYYGRWTYKLEEAARRGAAGVLLVHNDTMATYGWETVRNSWTGDQVRLLTPPTSLAFAGWVQQPVAASLLGARGLDLDRLMREAATREFHPVATGITADVTVRSTVRYSSAPNVVGRLPGSDPVLQGEVVAVTAHYDHHGIVTPPVHGDSIMNGAVDNASGTAAIIGVAEAFVRSGVRPRRSVLFVAFTGEEKGLLGSGAFAQRPPVPLGRMAALFNVDETNLFSATRDVAALGTDQSSLGGILVRAARAEGLRVTADSSSLLRGSFFRSDHFPLAKAGVPALSWESGHDAVGHPAGWLSAQWEAYNNERYHQPSDSLLPSYTLDGTMQQLRVLIRAVLIVGNATTQPLWNAGSEFRAAGEARGR